MNHSTIISAVKDIRKSVSIPLDPHGIFNPVLQYGVEDFCRKCQEIGIDGLILPDFIDVYQDKTMKQYLKNMAFVNVFLITPQTSNDRIHQIDAASDGFIYMVSSASVTGSQNGFGNTQESYFKPHKRIWN